jgi:hypothetical protein
MADAPDRSKTITVETTLDGNVSNQTFWTEESAAEYEARAARCGATTRRLPGYVHPLLRRGGEC